MMLAGSPLACIRRANSTFDLSSAFGRPMDWPRARRASRALTAVRGPTPIQARPDLLRRRPPSAPWRWTCRFFAEGTHYDPTLTTLADSSRHLSGVATQPINAHLLAGRDPR
jgi:hypothetical protein